MFPRPPLGRPSSFPLALAAASPSLVRSEIRSRSTSANNPNRAIITLVGRSCLPSNSIASLMAMKRILRRTRVSTIWITSERLRPSRDNSLTSSRSPGLERPQHFVDAALERTLARRDAGLDELVDREAAFLAELEDRQLLVGEVLRTSGDAEVGDGFQGGVQEKVNWGLFRSVKDYSIQNIV